MSTWVHPGQLTSAASSRLFILLNSRWKKDLATNNIAALGPARSVVSWSCSKLHSAHIHIYLSITQLSLHRFGCRRGIIYTNNKLRLCQEQVTKPPSCRRLVLTVRLIFLYEKSPQCALSARKQSARMHMFVVHLSELEFDTCFTFCIGRHSISLKLALSEF